jgi:excisionase family DNA binding protein
VDAPSRWLLTAEVAAILKVHPHTVARWAREGKLNTQRTLGGHRRYRESEIRALIADRAEVAA